MDTGTMIRELNNVAEKHSNDKLHTFDTNISAMCMDIIPKLEKLAQYEYMEEKGLIAQCTCKDCNKGDWSGCADGTVYCMEHGAYFSWGDS